MVRIWAKTIVNEKITRSIIYQSEGLLLRKDFYEHVVGVCAEMDIPTPMLTKSNTANFFNFNITRFKAADFIDSVDFDMLVLEDATQ